MATADDKPGCCSWDSASLDSFDSVVSLPGFMKAIAAGDARRGSATFGLASLASLGQGLASLASRSASLASLASIDLPGLDSPDEKRKGPLVCSEVSVGMLSSAHTARSYQNSLFCSGEEDDFVLTTNADVGKMMENVGRRMEDDKDAVVKEWFRRNKVCSEVSVDVQGSDLPGCSYPKYVSCSNEELDDFVSTDDVGSEDDEDEWTYEVLKEQRQKNKVGKYK
eukprot:gene19870-26564_t